MEQFLGITLNVSHYKDNDAILNILTNNELISCLGRGIFKQGNKNLIFTESFIKAEFELYKGKVGGYKLKDGKIISHYENYSKSFKKCALFNLISEIILKTRDGVTFNANLFDLVDKTLEGINDSKIEFNYAIYFILKYLEYLGIKPLFEKDSIYHFFNLDDGTFLNLVKENSNVVELNEIDLELFNLSYFDIDSFFQFKIKDEEALHFLNILNKFLNNKFDIKLNAIDLF